MKFNKIEEPDADETLDKKSCSKAKKKDNKGCSKANNKLNANEEDSQHMTVNPQFDSLMPPPPVLDSLAQWQVADAP